MRTDQCSPRGLIVLSAAVMCMCAGTLVAQNLHTGGYYKNYSQLYAVDYTLLSLPGVDPQGAYGMQHNYFRLQATYAWPGFFSTGAAYQIGGRIVSPDMYAGMLFAAPAESTRAYRVVDFDTRVYPPSHETRNACITHNLDRLHLTLRLPWMDVIAGRQAISWGSAKVVQPTDVVAPYSFDDLDKEEAPGVDALRVRIPMGMMNELDLGYITGDGARLEKSAVYARAKGYVAQTDLMALGMLARTHLLVGADVTRAVGGAGVWTEAAHVVTHLADSGARAAADDFFRLSCGVDYHLPFELYLFGEYHYNGAGVCDTRKYFVNYLGTGDVDQALSAAMPAIGAGDTAAVAVAVSSLPVENPAYRDLGVYLMGTHYISLGARYPITPLLGLHALGVYNCNDYSVTVAPRLEYNIAGDIYWDAGMYMGTGAQPRPVDQQDIMHGIATDAPLQDILPRARSEFGMSPDLFFTSLRIYF